MAEENKAKVNSDLDEYFTWEPEGENANNYGHTKDGLKIVNFYVDLNKEKLIKLTYSGRNANGLIKIVLDENPTESIDQSKVYNLNFKGRITLENPPEIKKESEIDEALRMHYSEVSNNWIKNKREERYKKQVESYFPREELSSRLKDVPNNKKLIITNEKLNKLIKNILIEKKVINEGQRVPFDSFWRKAVEDFMLERGYKRNGERYFKQDRDGK